MYIRPKNVLLNPFNQNVFRVVRVGPISYKENLQLELIDSKEPEKIGQLYWTHIGLVSDWIQLANWNVE